MLKIVEFSKIPIKMKNCKAFCKVQTANRLKKFIQSPPIPPPPSPPADKTLLYLENNFFFMEIYRNIQTFAFKGLQESSSWVARNGALQIFFLTPHRNMFARKFVKSERFFGCIWEHIIFIIK